MKILLILISFLSLNAQGARNYAYFCKNPNLPAYKYTISSTSSWDEFWFTVTESIKGASCQSRWGCDEALIHQEKLTMWDQQGVANFEGKTSKTRIAMEDLSQVSYSYVSRNSSGGYRTKHMVLNCEER